MNSHKYFLYVLLLVFFFSCTKDRKTQVAKKYEVEIANQINYQVMFGIDAIVEQMRKSTRYEGNRPADALVLKKAERLISLRRKFYIQDTNKANLLAYTDTILKIGKENFRNNSNLVTLKEITRLKNEWINSKDSLTQANLFFWSLRAESIIQNEYASRIGAPFKQLGRISSLINSKKLQLGDSVYIIITPWPFSDCFDFYFIKPKSCYILNKSTNDTLKLEPVKIGMQYLFYTIPKKRGKYEFHGKFLIVKSETGFPTDTTTYLIDEFKVL